jgi:hypothetical protein
MTPAGMAELERTRAPDEVDTPLLGDAAVVGEPVRAALADLCGRLKTRAADGSLQLDFDLLAEMVVDLRTIDAQLVSPRPKTAVVRACLQSIREALDTAADHTPYEWVTAFIGAG